MLRAFVCSVSHDAVSNIDTQQNDVSYYADNGREVPDNNWNGDRGVDTTGRCAYLSPNFLLKS